MKRQVWFSILVVGMLSVSPVLADDINDFATDPNLMTEWTEMLYYDGAGGGFSIATWNSENQNLDLMSVSEEGLGLLYKNGATRSDTDGVTLELSNYVSDEPAVVANWTCAGMVLTAGEAPNLFDGLPMYSLYLQRDYNNGIFYGVNNGLTTIFKQTLASVPETVKLDIVRDNSDYVFMVDDAEIFRDSAHASTSLPYYSIYWGGSATDSVSVSADNFGTVTSTTPVIPPVSPGVINFATNPNLSTEWATANFYDFQADGCPDSTATWNESNQNLDLVATYEEGLKMLYKKNTIRNEAEGITATFSNLNATSTAIEPSWACAGLLLSSTQTLKLFDATPTYGFVVQANIAADGETYTYFYQISSAANNQLYKLEIDTLPETIKFDIIEDDSEYVFLVNNQEIFRDSTYASESLSNFSMFWGGGGSCDMSLQADNFGTFTPSPSLPGDANGDGRVDGSDVTILAGNWQTLTNATWGMGDFNGDGKVDGSDVTILAGNWQAGVSTAAAAVPEPSTLVMLIVLAGGLMIWRRHWST